jgi:hypothetical protein
MGVRGEVFSTKVMLKNRTYFFNVKENRLGDLYLNIVESKNRDEGGFDRQSVILFAEDLQEFLRGFDDALRVLEKETREKHKGARANPSRAASSRAPASRQAGTRSVSSRPPSSRTDNSREYGSKRSDSRPRDSRRPPESRQYNSRPIELGRPESRGRKKAPGRPNSGRKETRKSSDREQNYSSPKPQKKRVVVKRTRRKGSTD